MDWYYLVAVCSLSMITSSQSATPAVEAALHSVELTFYQFHTMQWAEHEAAFKTALATKVNAYCLKYPTVCGLKPGVSLSLSYAEFRTVKYYPSDERRNMKLKIYLLFPSAVSGNMFQLSIPPITAYVLNKYALSTVLRNSRPTFRIITGSWIVTIGSEQIGYPPLYHINCIMIPIACGMLIILIIIASILYCHQKNEAKRASRALQIELKNRKRAGKIGPAPDAEHGGQWNGSYSLGGTEQWYMSDTSGQTNQGQISKEDPPGYHTIEVPDVTPEGAQQQAESEDGEKKERRRKKKHKKRRKNDKDDNNENNPADAEAASKDVKKGNHTEDNQTMKALPPVTKGPKPRVDSQK